MEKPILIVAVIFILIALAVVFFWWPKYQDFQGLRLQVREKKAELESKETYFSQLQNINEELKKYGSELAKIDAALPEQPSVAETFDFLEKAASQNGLVLGRVSTEKTGSQGTALPLDTRETSLSFSVAGSYPAFKSFLSQLETSARLISINVMSFAAGATQGSEEGQEGLKPGIFSFDLRAKIYSY